MPWNQPTFGKNSARPRHLTSPACCHEHAAESRMKRHPSDLFAKGRQPAPFYQLQPLKQPDRTFQCIVAGRLEPVDGARVAAPSQDVECGSGKIDSEHVRLAVRTEAIPRVPQANDAAG
jgi:hypothetical protein